MWFVRLVIRSVILIVSGGSRHKRVKRTAFLWMVGKRWVWRVRLVFLVVLGGFFLHRFCTSGIGH
jgi:hypothetical protein